MLVPLCLATAGSLSAESSRVNPEGQKPDDVRLKGQRTTNDKFHPWQPPTTKAAWEQTAADIRRQLLVACGLWPMPEKQPLEPVIHDAVDRGDYTVERVFFKSRPGHYVTGSLYRPKQSEGKLPGVLFAHGHWQDGRFHDAGSKAGQQELDNGGERYLSGARSPLQALAVHLTRMGCVVFFWDTVGVADNQPVPHREGFNDVDAELWQQNKLGLQTWNSIRALDFLTSLPDIDTSRIGVTGASGGGTQTFMLCALDQRPTACFPAVMVGTAMQGGCQCENASYLRVGINNIAIAALAAPRPMKLTGANDWTIDIETKGLPELKSIYTLLGKPELVDAKCLPQFGHNYNAVSREIMFDWFAEHLGLSDSAPKVQSDFWPMTRDELTVFDDKHPRPEDSWTAERLREEMTAESRKLFTSLIPQSNADVAKYREVVGGAAAVMLGGGVPKASELTSQALSEQTRDGVLTIKAHCGRNGRSIPTLAVAPAENFNGQTVVWIDGNGKSALYDGNGGLRQPVKDLLAKGYSVVSADVYLTGEFLEPGQKAEYQVDAGFPGYTFCYNAPLLAQRVQDILTVVGAAKAHPQVQQVHLVGTGDAGVWALLARAAAGDAISRTIVDLQGFRFANVKDVTDPNLLPGALKFGDIDGLAALTAPGQVAIYGASGEWPALQAMSRAAGGRAVVKEDSLNEPQVVELISR